MAEDSKIVIFGKTEQKTTPGTDRHLEPVVSAPAKLKKRSKRQIFKDEFVIEDTKKVKAYLLTSVIIPAIKDTIWNLVCKGLKMYLYKNGDAPNYQTGTPTVVPRTNYADIYNRTAMVPAYPVGRTMFNYGEPIVPNRGSADEAVKGMVELVRTSGYASVGDLYQLCKLPTDWPDFQCGWRDVSMIRVVEVDGGYLISLPRPMPL